MCRPTGSSAPDPLLPFDAASCERLLSGRARRLNVVVRVWTNVRRWPGCDFRRAPHFDQSRDANATVVARQAGAQAHPPPVRYLSNGHRNFPVLRRAERLPPACIAPTGFERACACAATVRHMMEALGVPHTEVELILINGESAGFDRLLREGDRVAVYPTFEAFDVTRPSAARDALCRG
jgi:hypothetical protein